MSAIKNPMHPGEFILQAYIEPLGISITDLAKKLDVSQSTLSRLINEKSDLSFEMIIRLSYVLGMSKESLVNMQSSYSLAQSEGKINFSKMQKIAEK